MSTTITSNPDFGFETTAEEAATSLASHIAGKVILVTGVTPGGLGAHFLEVTAPHKPRLLILAGRSKPKLLETANAIENANPGVVTRALELDLSSQSSVRKAAAEVLAWPEPIDVLVNNAGVMATPYQKTADGIEFQFGTNHIGHFLFTGLIAEKLIQSKARIVNVSSDGHRLSPIRFDDLQFSDGRTYDKWRAYGQTKTANILYTISLAEKLGPKGIKAFSLHPGAILTNLIRFLPEDGSGFGSLRELDRELGNKQGFVDFSFKNLTQGTATHVVAAFDPKLEEHNGAYLQDCQRAPDEDLKPYAVDPDSGEKLWKLSEELVGQSFSW